jgi:hypothetical protein
MVTVLSPRPVTLDLSKPLCPPVGALRGRRVGLRRDRFWLSWDWVTDEWANLLRADGADPIIWRAPVGKGDKEIIEGSESYAEFLASVDVVICGLCNCGSCTLWAVHDAVGALDTGIPTTLVVTEQFEALARILASQRGQDNLRVKTLPYPLEGRPEAEVRMIAREHYLMLVTVLGATR